MGYMCYNVDGLDKPKSYGGDTMKKVLFVVLFVCLLLPLGLSACKKEPNEIRFKTLSINDDNTAYLKVDYAVDSFSFADEVKVSGKATFTVSTDENGLDPFEGHIAPLAEGDNVLYVFQEVGDEVTGYVITIHRRYMCEVTFATDGGSAVDTQNVEEDSFATMPNAPQKDGYSFNGWDYDFSQAITTDTTVNAIWEINHYSITYHLNGGQNHADNPTDYTIEQEISFEYPTNSDKKLVFAGWYDNANFEGQNIEGLSGAFGEKNLYAKWERKTVLVLESIAGQSSALENTLIDNEYNVEVVNLKTGADIPQNVDELKRYHQIILNNVANKDLVSYDASLAPNGNTNQNLPKDFDKMLKEYVEIHGGGLLTVGGNDENGEQYSYVREDMQGSTYQDMLPVQTVDYSQPAAIMFIIDVSASMFVAVYNNTCYYDLTTAQASIALDSLTEKDYVGMTYLDSDLTGTSANEPALPLTTLKKKDRILVAFNNFEYENPHFTLVEAVETASKALIEKTDVEKRHIVLITEELPDPTNDAYKEKIKYYNENNGITFSVMGLGVQKNSDKYNSMAQIASVGKGNMINVTLDDFAQNRNCVQEEFNSDVVKKVIHKTFAPKFTNMNSPLANGVNLAPDSSDLINTTLNGFYGSELKNRAEAILIGDYDVPIYAQWQYGKGRVASFMCDLNGNWSTEFMSSTDGKKFISNLTEWLMSAIK